MLHYDAVLFEKALQRKLKRKKPIELTTAIDLSCITTGNPFVLNVLTGISRQGTDFLTQVDWIGASEEDLNAFECLLEQLSSHFRALTQIAGLEKYCSFVGNVMDLKPQQHEASGLLLF